MKRMLLENAKVVPYSVDKPIDRLGALSAILGIEVTVAATDTVATVTVTHSDAEAGEYLPVLDERLFLDATQVSRDGGGKLIKSYVSMPVSTGELLNIDIDLIGCDQFIQINVEYSGGEEPEPVTATYALALGDYDLTPPEV